MSALIDAETKQELQKVFTKLASPVKILFFTQTNSCPTYDQQRKLLEEITSLSKKITFEAFDLVMHGDESRNYRITKIPATVVLGKKDLGIRFYGVTAGYEFTSLLEAILMVSTEKSGLDPQIEALVKPSWNQCTSK